MDTSKPKMIIPDGNDPSNPVRIYTDGIFDCFHFGHAKVIEQCKKAFKYTHVTVGVCSDADTIEHKGKNVMTEDERAECVRHCKWADDVIVGCPWVLTMEFMDKNNFHYVAHDNIPYPYKDLPDLYGPYKESGRFYETQRTNGVSTTDLIVRILKDRNMYFERSLKKGVSPKELGLTQE